MVAVKTADAADANRLNFVTIRRDSSIVVHVEHI